MSQSIFDLQPITWEVLLSLGQLAVLISGGVWAFKRFKKEGSHTHRIEFDIECKFYGPQFHNFIAEITLTLKNRAKVRYIIKSCQLRIRGIEASNLIGLCDDPYKGRVCFPVKILPLTEIVPKDSNELTANSNQEIKETVPKAKWKFFSSEPEVTQRITFNASVPDHISFILAHARIDYDLDWPHTTEKIFKVSTEN
jgi:hypothetical protein